jgi:hypothetical protein
MLEYDAPFPLPCGRLIKRRGAGGIPYPKTPFRLLLTAPQVCFAAVNLSIPDAAE